MRRMILPASALLALAACHADVNVSDGDSGDGNGSGRILIKDGGQGGKTVSVKVAGFNADMPLPDLDVGGHVELDGIKMAPNTKVGNIDVNAHDQGGRGDGGRVDLSFTNPDTPASLIDHYARSATEAGFGDIVRTSGSINAHKGNKTFALSVMPQGTGSRGVIAMAGKN